MDAGAEFVLATASEESIPRVQQLARTALKGGYMATKQAVLLIHGIGEQRPMDTLQGFVDTVWTHDAEVQSQFSGAASWSKPDTVSESFELRRLTTGRNAAGIRTDFFEFYWAHLLQGTTYGHLGAWVKSLLWRNPRTVPRHLRGVYAVLLLAALAAVALALSSAMAKAADTPSTMPPWALAVLSVAIPPAVGAVLLLVVGDAARYLHVAPANIQRRHEIRQAGAKLLTALHQRGYERIVVVGHRLGSVIAYDILNPAWAAVHESHSATNKGAAALTEVERQVLNPGPHDTPDSMRAAQRSYVRELKANGNPWRVTDFITLGSPLAHASVLLAQDARGLTAKQQAREFPTAPPVTETIKRHGKPLTRFSFEPDGNPASTFRVAHHAAVFAATRWTNLYFPCRFIAWGDVVGGPLANWFGPGVKDVAVKTGLRWGLFSHTLYKTTTRRRPTSPRYGTH